MVYRSSRRDKEVEERGKEGVEERRKEGRRERNSWLPG